MSEPKPRRHVLPTIVAAQIMGVSLWFVGNAVLGSLQPLWPGVEGAVGWLTSSVQLGFIIGTVAIALFGLADRFAAHHVFFVSAVAGAAANAAGLLMPDNFAWFLGSRFVTGVCLAGIYPVGMKLAASWYTRGLGVAIGFLVGALVLGTALPHWLASLALDPTAVMLATSGLAVLGGTAIVLAVPEGPGVTRAASTRFADAWSVFREPGFRSAAFGYFGHMWELYAFWAFVPFALTVLDPAASAHQIGGRAFLVIAAGAIGCIVGGLRSAKSGSARVAGVQLGASGVCCLASPIVLAAASPGLGLAFLIFWGVVVAGDSPQFSAIAARSAARDRVGTGLTIMNAIGFALTIPAIQLLATVGPLIDPTARFLLLTPGPIIGLLALRPVLRRDPTRPDREPAAG